MDNKNKNNDENELITERRRKLSLLREQGNAFPNHFRRSSFADELHVEYDCSDKESLEKLQISTTVAGRMMVKRVMGKASFIKIQDASGQIQVRMERDRLPDGLYQDFKKWDVGDILNITGILFKTNTNELTVLADQGLYQRNFMAWQIRKLVIDSGMLI